MRLTVDADTYLVLDLDDTLYPEVDFVASGMRAVARRLRTALGEDVFPALWERYRSGRDALSWASAYAAASGVDVRVATMLRWYREHEPDIELGPGVRRFLDEVVAQGAGVGLVTDGRSVTQRNKIAALGLEPYLDDVVISEEIGSEKPDPRNYRVFEERRPARRFVCIGDNTTKDFVVPARLGWRTICVRDRGRHIHRQAQVPDPRPDHLISSFEDIEVIAAGAAGAASTAGTAT